MRAQPGPRLRYQVAVRLARTLTALALAAAVGLSVTAAAAAAPRRVPVGFYGMMYDGAISVAPRAVQEAEFARMARSGVESVRAVFPWAGAQPVPGPINFTATDQLVGLAAAHRVRVLPVVIYAPPWAELNNNPGISPPRNPADYAAYLRALVRRYGPRGSFWAANPGLPRVPIREWQVWNEPTIRTYWNVRSGRRGNVVGYGALLRASYRAIKRADRRAKVVLAALPSKSWLDLIPLYRSGHIRRYFDVVALNPFASTPRLSLRVLQLVRRTMSRFHDSSKPIDVTEVTWPASRGQPLTSVLPNLRFLQTSDAGMARRLSDAYRLFVRNRRRLLIRSVYWYDWASSYQPGSDFDFAGLVRYRDGVVASRPALAAYRGSARHYEGCVKTDRGTCR
jgi:Beta-galactosidase